MFIVYEVFPDGKRFFMYRDDDHFNCEVWVSQHDDCTTALLNRWSKLVIVEE